MLKRLLNTFKKIAKAEKGYTLIEVASVVAITATLAAVAVPVALDKVNEGKIVSALQDTKQIGATIAAFYKDVGEFPAFDGAAKETMHVLRSGDQNDQKLGTGFDPVGAGSTKWVSAAADGVTDLLENHLVKDNPGGTNDAYLDASLNWKGPYADTFTKRDPWGNNYLVYIRAFYKPTTGVGTKEYGWIISAGPNAKLETEVTDNKLQEDDIGYYPFAAETGHN